MILTSLVRHLFKRETFSIKHLSCCCFWRHCRISRWVLSDAFNDAIFKPWGISRFNVVYKNARCWSFPRNMDATAYSSIWTSRRCDAHGVCVNYVIIDTPAKQQNRNPLLYFPFSSILIPGYFISFPFLPPFILFSFSFSFLFSFSLVFLLVLIGQCTSNYCFSLWSAYFVFRLNLFPIPNP